MDRGKSIQRMPEDDLKDVALDAAVAWLASLSRPGSNTDQAYRSGWNMMMKTYGQKAVAGPLSQDDVRRIYADMLKHGSVARANLLMSTMSSYWNFLVKQRLAEENPYATTNVRRERADNHLEERILERDEVRAIVEHGRTEHDQLMLRFLYLTWLRIDEASKAQWGRVSSRRGIKLLTVRGKGGKTRTITLPDSLYRALETLMPWPKDEGPESRILRQRNGKSYSTKQIERVMEAAVKRAGLPFWDGHRWLRRPTPHWMRHAGATHALEDGMSVNVVQQRLGHESLNTTSVYVKATAQMIEASQIPDPWA